MKAGPLLLAATIALIANSSAAADREQRMRLTLEAPSFVAQPPASVIAGGSTTLRISIVSIENPGMTPFGVIVSTGSGEEIGRFAVFPPDQAGDYNLALTSSEQAALEATGATLVVKLDLIGEAREPLSVEFGRIDAR